MDLTSHVVQDSRAIDFTDLQARTDAFLSNPSCDSTEANLLIRLLADAGQTAATIRVWDATPKREATSWEAIDKLHRQRNIEEGTIKLPPLAGRVLTSSRRLHKIWKGRKIHQRSEKAKLHLDDAIVWLNEQYSKGRVLGAHTSSKRMKLAKELAKELHISVATARGLVTKLKQKKLLEKQP
jgi:hypothetical protein